MLGRTVRELETGMGAFELAEWRQLCEAEVVGDERSDYWNAMLISTYSNVHRDRKRFPTPFDLSDFMPGRAGGNHGVDDEDPLLRNDSGS
jgi:hypothetical protein